MTDGPNQTPPPAGQYGRPEHPGRPEPDATLVPGGSPGKGRGGLSHGTRMALAVVAAVAMVAGTTVAGVLLTGGDGGEPAVAAPGGDDEENGGAEGDGEDVLGGGEEPEETDEEDAEDRGSDPRGSTGPPADPVVDDWQVQALPARDLAYDVPPGEEWEVVNAESYVEWRPVIINDDGEEEELLYVVRGGAVFEGGVCGANSSRGVIGITGSRGSSGTEEAARSNALEYARAVYDPTFTGELVISDPEPFTNDHGFEGHISVGELTGFDLKEGQDPECYATDATVVSVAYLDSSHDVQVWLAILDADVEGELDEETLDTITGSLRLLSRAD
ncbi:hypothetical protein [Streptomyces bohaiensis]|uniref:DUF8017 domain-containing protein n=1 Tax=Streptomyces bohaiensis TaxID=1431344 RepID=A0ABX1C406_9ACTN|nr:hypothetical protein [Streptomyces bohaiensis]NJQ13952.1 hypothetical protein [Streptomyces bohaiensis]